MIREFTSLDDIETLTRLLHEAYSSHADGGIRFFASYQSPTDTANRIAKGRCFMLEVDSILVGTVTVFGSSSTSEIDCYRENGTFTFSQFAVHPEYQGRGYGRLIHNFVIEYVKSQGGTALAIDTALPAKDLISMYKKWGYREIGSHRWSVTNYESIVMKCELGDKSLSAKHTSDNTES